MTTCAELAEKLARVRAYLDRAGASGLVLQSPANFAWITCGGDSHIQITAEDGAGTALVTPDRACLICSNVEHGRLREEEVAGLDLEFVVHDWHDGSPASILQTLVPSGGLVSDSGIAGSTKAPSDIHALQRPLMAPERDRYRDLGSACGRILGAAMLSLEPGMSEHEVAALIAEGAHREDVLPAVVLVAADERIAQYRHPIPTDKAIEHCVMGVLVGRKYGLYSSETRLVHFGAAPADLLARHAAVTRVDAALMSTTKPGVPVSQIMAAALDAYAETGHPDEWRLHHQGGATGYAARTYKGLPNGTEVVSEGEAFAWNPSITGTKSEDTILVTSEGTEVLSMTPGWPTIEVEMGGQTWHRPDIMVR